jgi:hypothetical protein
VGSSSERHNAVVGSLGAEQQKPRDCNDLGEVLGCFALTVNAMRRGMCFGR